MSVINLQAAFRAIETAAGAAAEAAARAAPMSEVMKTPEAGRVLAPIFEHLSERAKAAVSTPSPVLVYGLISPSGLPGGTSLTLKYGIAPAAGTEMSRPPSPSIVMKYGIWPHGSFDLFKAEIGAPGRLATVNYETLGWVVAHGQNRIESLSRQTAQDLAEIEAANDDPGALQEVQTLREAYRLVDKLVLDLVAMRETIQSKMRNLRGD